MTEEAIFQTYCFGVYEYCGIEWMPAKGYDGDLQTIFYKGIMPSEKVLDFPVDCNTLTGSVNL